MKILFPVILLFGSLIVGVFGCSSSQTKSETSKNLDTSALQFSPEIISVKIDTTRQLNRITDSRDGEMYAIVTIGKQTWMAENLRYNISGSWVNPNYPSRAYGRLYNGITAQTICPEGWHLPSDLEWNQLEMTLGMSAADVDKTGWRGEHGTKMKSVVGWANEGNGTNSSGFNALPGGYYFDEDSLGGFGNSMGYWSSLTQKSNGLFTEDSGKGAWVRFLAGPLKGVNRFYDDKLGPESRVACRCLKN